MKSDSLSLIRRYTQHSLSYYQCPTKIDISRFASITFLAILTHVWQLCTPHAHYLSNLLFLVGFMNEILYLFMLSFSAYPFGLSDFW